MPEKIGRYEIKGIVGRGGMGTVYHGYDPRFERDVAIKVLPAHSLAQPGLRARFEREAKTIAALEHPAIVSVYDFDEADGQPYLVMQFMTGGSLSDRLAEGPLPTEEAATILTRIGSALDEAHKRGVVHRDLKPGNILFDRYGNAYLSDFGIVSLAEYAGDLTGTGAIGTPGYMSPEQIQGQTIDGRTDIYALGVLMFEMLTGRKPYSGDTPAMILVRQMTEPPPELRAIRPDLPVEVDEVIERSLSRDKNQRPSSAGEVARLLSLAARGPTYTTEQPTATALPAQPPSTSVAPLETIRVSPTPPPPPSVRPAVPGTPASAPSAPTAAGKGFPWLPVVVGVVALMAVALIIVGGLIVLNRDRIFGGEGEQADAAQEDEADSESAGDGESAGDELGATADLLGRAWDDLENGNLEAAVALAGEALSGDPDNIEAHLIRLNASRELGDFDTAFADIEALIALEPEMPDWYVEQAWTYDWIGEHERAVESMERCIEIAPENDQCWQLKGAFHSYLDEHDLARDAWLRAVELNPGNVEALFGLAHQAFWVEEDPDLARDYVNRAVDASDGDPYAHLSRAQLLREMGDVDAAAADYRYFLDSVPPEDCPDCTEEAATFLSEIGGGPSSSLVPGGQAIFLNPAFPPLGDVRVRRALAHALLREEFVAMAAEGGASEALRPATTWLHPDILGIDLAGEVGAHFDPDHARQLMAEAGFEGGEGFPELTFLVDPEHEELGLMAVTMWRDTLGIEVALEVDGGDYLGRVFQDPPAIFRLGYFLSPDEPDADTLYKNWFHTNGGNNVLLYSNPRVDELLQAAYDTDDHDARNEMYTEVEGLITTDDAIVIPLYHDYTEH